MYEAKETQINYNSNLTPHQATYRINTDRRENQQFENIKHLSDISALLPGEDVSKKVDNYCKIFEDDIEYQHRLFSEANGIKNKKEKAKRIKEIRDMPFDFYIRPGRTRKQTHIEMVKKVFSMVQHNKPSQDSFEMPGKYSIN